MSKKMDDFLEEKGPAVRTTALHPEIDLDDPRNSPGEKFKMEENLNFLLPKDVINGLSPIPLLQHFVTLLLADTDKNFEDRLARAIKATAVPVTVMEMEETKELIFQELTQKYPIKAQLLMTKQIMLWNTNRQALEGFTDTDKIKEINLRDKISDLQDKLSEQVEKLYSEIYGVHQDIAKEQVKKTMSPEQRLKSKKSMDTKQ